MGLHHNKAVEAKTGRTRCPGAGPTLSVCWLMWHQVHEALQHSTDGCRAAGLMSHIPFPCLQKVDSFSNAKKKNKKNCTCLGFMQRLKFLRLVACLLLPVFIAVILELRLHSHATHVKNANYHMLMGLAVCFMLVEAKPGKTRSMPSSK